ncbi:MAG TPA: reverse transcriptase family protein [Pedobacter sp.]|jgi:hypothetical protein
MKLPKEEIDHIQKAFHKMKSKADLLVLLNYSKRFIYGHAARPFDLRQLNYNATDKANPSRYTKFVIKKKSGNERVIYAPAKGLKSIQKCLNLILQCVFTPHPAANGFITEKSIVSNARNHIGRNYVFNIDLKDFFPSIDQARVWKCFQIEPFFLNENNKNVALAGLLASICCTEMEVERESTEGQLEKVFKNVLPQGAPTSPTISNIVCRRLDTILTGVAKRFGLVYSRYADDITFSSSHNVFQAGGEFIKEVERVIGNQNFAINTSKTRLQRPEYKQEVTGLIVNSSLNTPRRYRKQLRAWLYLWETYGYNKAYDFFLKDYIKSKGRTLKVPDMDMVIGGKLDYLRMVKGDDSTEYRFLIDKFRSLHKKPIKKPTASSDNNIPVPFDDRGTLNSQELFRSANIPIMHHPKELVSLLSSFSQHSVLKYVTHSWEQGAFDGYEHFITKLPHAWGEMKNKIYPLSPNLWAKIKAFIVAENVRAEGWGHPNPKMRVRYGWRSPQLQDWCFKNPEKSPFYFPIPEEDVVTIDGIKINYFYNVTEVFKRQIEIREENNHLYNLFLELRKDILGYDFKLEQVNTKGQTFYTDVQWFRSALEKIFESIRSRPNFPNIKISVVSTDNDIEIKIVHIGSSCSRDVKHPRITSPVSGDFNSILNELKNLCDWSIESKFADGKYYRVNYLTSEESTQAILSTDYCDGFTHILKFYL